MNDEKVGKFVETTCYGLDSDNEIFPLFLVKNIHKDSYPPSRGTELSTRQAALKRVPVKGVLK